MAKKKKEPEPEKPQPKRPDVDPNKTPDTFMKVWKARHGK